MIPAFSVEENMMLSSIDRYTKSGWFQKRAADKKARDMIEALKIKCVGVSQPAKELSGGNHHSGGSGERTHDPSDAELHAEHYHRRNHHSRSCAPKTRRGSWFTVGIFGTENTVK